MKILLKYILLCIGSPVIAMALIIFILYSTFAVTTGLEDLKIIKVPESSEEHVLKTLPEYDDGDMWVYGNWQNFTTVYGEYKFSDTDGYFESERNTLFKPVDEEMLSHFENRFYPYYEFWVDETKDAPKSIGDDLTKVCRFDTGCMDSGDWYYYEGGEYESHTYYYFDVQSQTLYLLNYHT